MTNVERIGEIVVLGRFDGGNPQCSSDIVKVDDAVFRIYPYSEDRDDNYMFRVDVKVCSSYREPKPVTMFFEWRAWRAERYMEERDLFYCKHEDGEWKLQSGQVEGNVTKLTLTVPPGETIVSMNPTYNYETLERYVRSLKGNLCVEAWIAGFSHENRNIWCIKITDKKVADEKKHRLMIIARVHPYESAASYCIESMMNHLLSRSQDAKKLLSDFIFYIVPMPNPDGVYNGLCKLTRVNGFDFSHGNVSTSKDKACKTVLGLAGKIRPQFVLDMHSLMSRDIDQLGCSEERLLNEFKNLMPDQVDVGRRWRILFRNYEAPTEHPSKRLSYSFRSYCTEELGATSFLLGFSWYGRSLKKMEQAAVKALKVLTTSILTIGASDL